MYIYHGRLGFLRTKPLSVMGIFSKQNGKASKKANDPLEQRSEQKSLYESPKIICIDLPDNVTKEIESRYKNTLKGTLGSIIRLPRFERRDQLYPVLPDISIPLNAHEYDIFIVDLFGAKEIDYASRSHSKKHHSDLKSEVLAARHPQTIFNPRPLGSDFIGSSLRDIKNRDSLLIVFGAEVEMVDYDIYSDEFYALEHRGSLKFHTYCFHPQLHPNNPQSGREFLVASENNDLSALLRKYLKQFIYHQSFYKADGFEPLLTTQNGDLVSLIYQEQRCKVVLFPQVLEQQAEFLVEFLTEVAPKLFPSLFPESTLNGWKNEKQYWLPNHQALIEEEARIHSEYVAKLEDLNRRQLENQNQFEFLQRILTETSDELTNSLITFFRWLGFKDVVDYDSVEKNSKVFEEDIQIKLPNGSLLIIECKGIGGTSTDDQCSQISKVKFRRSKERGRFDVFALYVVNHQRHLPPLSRKNPPFQSQQIEDAQNDERGLVSTWDLFQLYFSIENGVITKEEARIQLLNFGLIEFKPTGLVRIDEPKEIFKEGKVCIVNIDNIEIEVGDEIFEEKNGKYQKLFLEKIKQNDRTVDRASSGELGIELSGKISKNSTLWKRQVPNESNT